MDINESIKKLYELKSNMPDLIIREINVPRRQKVYVLVIQTLTSEDKVNDFILKYFSNKDLFKNKTNIKKSISEFIPAINFHKINNYDEILNYLFNGFTVVLSNKFNASFETKALIDRAVSESSSEPSVRGPKDSFNENYQTNIGLIRRRIKDKNLYLKEIVLGKKSKTRIGIMYMNGIASDDLIHQVQEKLNNIDIEYILDSYTIKELIKKENKTLFPTIASKEKPDEISVALLNGKIAIIVENSPNVLLIPTLFLDSFKNSEDYYEKSFYASFIRIIRLFAFFLAIFLPGFYLALITIDQQVLSSDLFINFASQSVAVPFPSVIEAILLTITFEILYEGDSRTPTSRGASVSILGALILGDAAVNAGLVSPIMVIIISISSICSLLFIFVDFQGSIRFWRYLCMILSSLFGLIGFIVTFTLLLINLCSIKSFGIPYLIPYVPFYKKEALKDGVIRSESSSSKIDKDYLRSNDEKN